MEEIPKEKVIYVTCNVGRTAYYASRILIQNGYDARLLPGGWNTYRILAKTNYSRKLFVIDHLEKSSEMKNT